MTMTTSVTIGQTRPLASISGMGSASGPATTAADSDRGPPDAASAIAPSSAKVRGARSGLIRTQRAIVAM